MKKTINVKDLTMIGLGAALMGVFSQISIPLPMVALTLQVFGVVLLTVILEGKLAGIAMIIYTLIGAIGIPVFAGFSSGLSVLIGPTGGYIIGFVVLAYIVGLGIKLKSKVGLYISVYIGLMIQYTMGTVWLKFVLDVPMGEALVIGVYPFIVKDLILVGIAVVCGLQIKERLKFVKTRQISH